jgi:charged multivesicular body protein 5
VWQLRECNQQLLGFQRQLKAAKTPAAQRMIKQRALQVLKRKKMYEQQLNQLQGMHFNMERMDFALETIKSTKDQVTAMKGAATTLKGQMAAVNLDELEDMADDISDMLADADEVQQVLGQSFSLGDDVTEAELDDELSALEAEGFGDLESELAGLDSEVSMFGPPTTAPVAPVATGEGARVPAAAAAAGGGAAPAPVAHGLTTDEFGAPMLG